MTGTCCVVVSWLSYELSATAELSRSRGDTGDGQFAAAVSETELSDRMSVLCGLEARLD